MAPLTMLRSEVPAGVAQLVESTRLISAGSAVRVRPPAPILAGGRTGQDGPHRDRPFRPVHRPACPRRCSCSTASGGPSGDTISRGATPAWSSRCPAGPIRSRSRTCCASSTAAGELRVAGLAHFNHQLRAGGRPATSGSAPTWPQPLERPLLVDREDVAAARGASGGPSRMRRGRARHAFLERARAHFGADVVALGHTRDDQAETFLLRLLRGAGPRGLAAMHPRSGALIRPLLDCRRAALRRISPTRRIAFVEDESNEDVEHSAQPGARRAAAAARAALQPARSWTCSPTKPSSRARSGSGWPRGDDRAVVASVPARGRDTWRLGGCRARRRAPAGACPALVRSAAAMIERMLAAAGRSRSPTSSERMRLVALRTGPPVDAPGQRVERIGGDLVLTGRPAARSGGRQDAANRRPRTFFRYPLSIPGEVRLAEAGCVAVRRDRRRRGEPCDRHAWSSDGASPWSGCDRCGGPLSVRNRRPGDRFRPLGLGGRKKLQDYLRGPQGGAASAATPSRWWWTTADRIVWVAGYAIDEEFRVTDPAQAVLILRLKRSGRLCVNSTLEESVVLDRARRRRCAHLELLDEVPAARSPGHVSASSCRGSTRAASQRVVITGQEITGYTKARRALPHLRAGPVRRSRQQADRTRRRGPSRRSRRRVPGRRCSTRGRPSC